MEGDRHEMPVGCLHRFLLEHIIKEIITDSASDFFTPGAVSGCGSRKVTTGIASISSTLFSVFEIPRIL